MNSEAMTVLIKDLFQAAPPTKNPLTDGFGLFRDWGTGGWSPSEEYSPVHTGIDYSAKPDQAIVSPIDGYVWGEKIAGMVGSYCIIRPDHSDQFLFTFFHCEPTGAEWRKVKKGFYVTHQAGYGIGAPHLHFELATTHSMGSHLRHRGVLKHINWRAVVEKRCAELGFNLDTVLARVRTFMASRGVIDIGENYVVVSGLPDYRRTKHSRVGIGPTYLMDPRVVL